MNNVKERPKANVLFQIAGSEARRAVRWCSKTLLQPPEAPRSAQGCRSVLIGLGPLLQPVAHAAALGQPPAQHSSGSSCALLLLALWRASDSAPAAADCASPRVELVALLVEHRLPRLRFAPWRVAVRRCGGGRACPDHDTRTFSWISGRVAANWIR